MVPGIEATTGGRFGMTVNKTNPTITIANAKITVSNFRPNCESPSPILSEFRYKNVTF